MTDLSFQNERYFVIILSLYIQKYYLEEKFRSVQGDFQLKKLEVFKNLIKN